MTGAESSVSGASVRIQLEGAIPEIVSGRFGIDTVAPHCLLATAFCPPVFFAHNDRRMTFFSLSLKTREGSGLIFRQSEDFVQTNHPEDLSNLF